MTWQERITLDPAVLAGKPVIRNTRLSVDFIVGLAWRGLGRATKLPRHYPRGHVPALCERRIGHHCVACIAIVPDINGQYRFDLQNAIDLLEKSGVSRSSMNPPGAN